MRTTLRRPRPRTRPIKTGLKTVHTVQRCCNGCGRRLGDMTTAETNAAQQGLRPPDVRNECPACTPHHPGLTWQLRLPITRPLSMNDRLSWHAKHRAKSELRAAVRELAMSRGIPPLRALTAELHYAPADRRIRDPLNLIETLKVCEDALVDANLVPDDNPLYVTSTMPVIDPPQTSENQGRLYLIVRELHPAADDTIAANGRGTHQ